MWASLLRLSIRSTIFSVSILIVFLVLGAYGLLNIQIDAIPDITNNQVQIYTYAPGYSASEVEAMITRPIESALATIPKRIEWRSISRMGLSLITIVFEEGVDIYQARAQIIEKLLTIKDQLPPGVQPELGPLSTGLSEAYQYILQPAQPVSLAELRTIQDWIVRRALLETPGVADISSFGGYVKRWEIHLNPEALQRYGLSLTEVENALLTANHLLGIGYIERGGSTIALRAEGVWRSGADIEQVVVGQYGDQPIRLIDVGAVRQGHLPRYGALIQDTLGEVVGGIVLIRKGENTAEVVRRLKLSIAELEKNLPHGIRIKPFLDREALISRLLRTVLSNLTKAAVIVIGLLTILLGSLRAGLLVGLVIPLSMLFALGLMSLTGLSANLMSLGAIDFGLIVDGAVILVEAVIVRLAHYKDRITAAEEGAIHIRKASLFGELVVVSVYVPLLLLTGIEGKMFRPMVWTMLFALVGALILSLTFVPWASARVLTSTHWLPSERLNSYLQKLTSFAFRHSLRRPYVAIAAWILLFGGGAIAFRLSETIFLPELDEGAFAVETRLPLGSSLQQTIKYCSAIHKLLLTQLPGAFSDAVAKIGTSEIPMDPMFVESADIILDINPHSPLSRAELADSLKALVQAHFPGIFIGVQQPIQMRFNELLAGARTDIVLRLVGPNLDTLRRWGEVIAGFCEKIPGIADLSLPLFFGSQQIVVRWKSEALAFYGVDLSEALRWVQAYKAGIPLGMVQTVEGWRFATALRLAPEKLPEDLRMLPIPTRKREWIALERIAEIQIVPSYNEIPHAEGERTYQIGINVRGRGAISVVQDIQKFLHSISLPTGYRVRFGGTWENYVSAQQRLFWLIPLTVGLIALLMYLTIPHLRAIGIILVVALAAPAGGMLSLVLRGMPFSLSAAIGLIGAFGLATLNGTVLLNRFYALPETWSALRRMRYAVAERTRPILATTLIAVAGLLPMAFSVQPGAEVQRPFATTIIGGLLIGAAFNLWVLPIFFSKRNPQTTQGETPQR
ncbi:MAG: CusA/CzcA family heavy metal efflux RND transporter [Bacteroidia bacterium]|nr:CusA/CzcA family heavy metal efflux RND transporter [Bacteroidia bacterium]MCX7652447.1 CusA/CzcA family heavy metal efflux RND transporter [Bacteroidia bacterium]MDW8416848.1 CusA/CzcA family heavy metal efflux RND transporter [Bacteroidia bacterium]